MRRAGTTYVAARMTPGTAYSEFVMAMERVERRLRLVTEALDAARIPYAVVGGNAVAAWIAQVDPAATRTTKDVDILVRRCDLEGVTKALTAAGLRREDLRSLVLFVDPAEPSRRCGVHLVWAGEKVRPSYGHPAPDVTEARRPGSSFAVLDLPALVRMKLTSFRDIDRVHVADLLDAGLITDGIRAALPPDLQARLDDVASALDPE
jgi:hypothetical protein